MCKVDDTCGCCRNLIHSYSISVMMSHDQWFINMCVYIQADQLNNCEGFSQWFVVMTTISTITYESNLYNWWVNNMWWLFHG